LDSLLGRGLDFAESQLAEHGEFYPFAIAVQADGQQVMIAPDARQLGEHPASDDVIAACWRNLIDRRNTLRAAAVVLDIRLMDGSGDAVEVNAEHAEGVALSAVAPYTRKRLRNAVEFGRIRASAGVARIWAVCF